MVNGKNVARLSKPPANHGKIKIVVKEKKNRVAQSVIFNEGLINVVQQYLKKGANVYIEGQLSTRKWKDEASGQDKYSTEIVLQGYNSFTMLDGKNKSGTNNLVNDEKLSSDENIKQVEMI